jgi:hypothetical protein
MSRLNPCGARSDCLSRANTLFSRRAATKARGDNP